MNSQETVCQRLSKGYLQKADPRVMFTVVKSYPKSLCMLLMYYPVSYTEQIIWERVHDRVLDCRILWELRNVLSKK
jgi:hypothetical protein